MSFDRRRLGDAARRWAARCFADWLVCTGGGAAISWAADGLAFAVAQADTAETVRLGLDFRAHFSVFLCCIPYPGTCKTVDRESPSQTSDPGGKAHPPSHTQARCALWRKRKDRIERPVAFINPPTFIGRAQYRIDRLGVRLLLQKSYFVPDRSDAGRYIYILRQVPPFCGFQSRVLSGQAGCH